VGWIYMTQNMVAMAASTEHGKEISNTIKFVDYLDQLTGFQLHQIVIGFLTS
jgi:hypothetical protein